MASTSHNVPRRPLQQDRSKPIKAAVVGVGSVGSTTAYSLLLSGLVADIVLIDVNHRKAEGEAMDISHAAPLSHQTQIWAGTYEDCAGAEIVVITAGANQKPGQTRMDLLKTNYGIFQDIIPKVVHYATDAILVIATNPVDVLTYAAVKLSGLPAHRVIGSGTVLDTARLRYELGKLYDIDPKSIYADVIGEHGDTELPVWSLASIAGMRLEDYCRSSGTPYDRAAMDTSFEHTKRAAYDIIQRKGMTNYGIATGLTRIIETILRDENTLLTVSGVGSYCGIDDVSLSMPFKVNRAGAQLTTQLMLSPDEEKELKVSAKSIQNAITSLSL